MSVTLTDWIDNIPDLWATIPTHEGGTLRAHKMFESDDFPEAIEAPAVITYPTGVNLTYSRGGPLLAHWYGRSDFYLFDNVSKSNIPQLAPYFRRIMVAAFGSFTLGATVVNFSIGSSDVGQLSIQGPVELTFGDETPKHGLVVNWYVKEDLSGDSDITTAISSN